MPLWLIYSLAVSQEKHPVYHDGVGYNNKPLPIRVGSTAAGKQGKFLAKVGKEPSQWRDRAGIAPDFLNLNPIKGPCFLIYFLGPSKTICR